MTIKNSNYLIDKIKMIFRNLRETAIRYVFDSYLLWFNSVATMGVLPLSHTLFIFFTLQNHCFYILYCYTGLAVIVAFATDFVLLSKERRKSFSILLKKYTTPELFAIYGNPGEAAAAKLAGKMLGSKVVVATGAAAAAAAAGDHVLTHTGAYDSLSYAMNTQSGMSSEQAFSRLPKERYSAIDALVKKKF